MYLSVTGLVATGVAIMPPSGPTAPAQLRL